jgi:predicted Zn-dependent protease with MMP-like domain
MKRMPMKQFAEVVRRAVEALPPEIAEHLTNVVIDVEKVAPVELLQDMGFTDDEIDAGDTIYGIFMPMGPSATDMLENPNRIVIYRNALEEDFPDSRDLETEIRKTVVHEIAHHFGLTDRDLERFDANPDPFGE